MRGRILPLLAATVALLLVPVVGCGGGGGGQPQQQQQQQQQQEKEGAEARAFPGYGDLRPGKYVTGEFEPTFSFEVVDEGWIVGGTELRGLLDMRQGLEGGVLSFLNVQEVFDPGRPRELASVPAPEDMVAWLRGHPYLETERPEPATVGGVEGAQLDAAVADVPASECGDACLGLFEADPESGWVAYEGEKLRFIVLEDVGDERVIIAVEARAADFEEFAPKAQGVIDTVQWTGK